MMDNEPDSPPRPPANPVKWTLGPWLACKPKLYESPASEVTNIKETDNPNGPVLAWVLSTHPDDEVWANAQIMAAAPDLYEALLLAMLWMTVPAATPAQIEVYSTHRQRMLRALAKARGENV